MNKQEMVAAIEYAGKAHINQMNKIEALIEGKKVNELTPVAKTKCDFGKWLYGDSENIRIVLGVQFFDNLDLLHETWHIEYSKIYNIFFGEPKAGLFAKLFSSNKINTLEIEKAKVYYKDLQKATQDLLRALEVSQRRVLALNESKFH